MYAVAACEAQVSAFVHTYATSSRRSGALQHCSAAAAAAAAAPRRHRVAHCIAFRPRRPPGALTTRVLCPQWPIFGYVHVHVFRHAVVHGTPTHGACTCQPVTSLTSADQGQSRNGTQAAAAGAGCAAAGPGGRTIAPAAACGGGGGAPVRCLPPPAAGRAHLFRGHPAGGRPGCRC